jgi:hypothetical protein
MRTVLLHLERLRRHYQFAVRTHDTIALLDLSHSLRVWAELKMALPRIAPVFGKTLAFKTAIPPKKAMRAARDKQHVFSYMPGGVVTYASSGQVLSLPEMSGPGKACSVGASVKVMPDGSLVMKNYYFVSGVSGEQLAKSLNAEDQTRCNYPQWMGAEAVRLCYLSDTGALRKLSISREMIVKRVANTMDGSHPSAAGSPTDGENSFDEAVHHLLQYTIGGLPLPYFILLKIAQDILSIVPKLIDDSLDNQEA